jgi:hypothetical protein
LQILSWRRVRGAVEAAGSGGTDDPGALAEDDVGTDNGAGLDAGVEEDLGARVRIACASAEGPESERSSIMGCWELLSMSAAIIVTREALMADAGPKQDSS